MLVEERRQRVLDLVSAKGFVALDDLARDLGASHSTIRRDLEYWHKQGTVQIQVPALTAGLGDQ